MFAKATRMKLRFNYKGQIGVEELWDLPLNALDQVYKDLKKESKEQIEDSLLNTQTPQDSILALKIEIVTYIVKTKIEEKVAKETAKTKAMQKEKLLDILARKQDEHLQNLSPDDLKKMIDELGN